jgi:NAD(P)-dependent dehydrogenase (short-subunit alcohol dehydrogenase family)
VTGDVALVTGANTGVGKETAKALAARGCTTILACRDERKATSAAADIVRATGNSRVLTVTLDLGDLHSVASCTDEVLGRVGTVEVLVNNAGGYWDPRATTAQGLEQHFGVNYLSHYFLTRRLLESLGGSAPSRVVNVTSFGHRAVSGMAWDDLQLEHGWSVSRAYGQSKLAQLLFTRELARRFGEVGVTAHAAHPGVVRSEFGRNGDTRGVQHVVLQVFALFGVSPAKGARTAIHLATSDDALRSNGGYWVRSTPHQPSKAARDDESARRLWDVSHQLVTSSGLPLAG